jgi:uncharacterized phage infection (PIP) family protein YhgE
MRWLTAAVTVALITAPVAADEMQDAMDRADALNLMRQIQVQPTQARAMIDPLENIQQIIDEYNSQREGRLNKLKPTLQRARRQLAQGAELSEQMQSALDNYAQQREQARQAVYRQVNEEMQKIAQILSPEQNRYLDWTPPGSIRPEQRLEERLEMQRIAMGRIQEAAQVLNQIKNLDAFNFVTGRGPIINDYLALYFQPDSRQFQQAYGLVLEYSDQVRMMDEQQWQAEGLDIGALLVEDLGLMPAMDPGQRPGTMSWNRLFVLMTDSQTLEVAEALAQ